MNKKLIFKIVLTIIIILLCGMCIYNLYNKKQKVQNINSIKYETEIRDEVFVTIKAIRDNEVISREFEMEALIDKINIVELPNIGNVVLVSDTGGEYCGVHIYKLLNNEIQLIGNIDCGIDMVKEAEYEFEILTEKNISITANIDNKKITKNIETQNPILDINIINVLDYGKIILVTEKNNDYETKVYRYSEDYIQENSQDIVQVGIIKYKEVQRNVK